MKDETNWNFWPCFCCFCCVRSELLVLFLCVYNKCSSEIKLLSGGLTKQTPTGRMEDGFLCHHLPSTWTDPAGSSWKTDSRHPAFLEKLVPCKMRLFEPSAHVTLHCDAVRIRRTSIESCWKVVWPKHSLQLLLLYWFMKRKVSFFILLIPPFYFYVISPYFLFFLCY